MNIRLVPSTFALLAAATLTLFTSGCPQEGVVCAEGLTACGAQACEDLGNDPRNCGACGAVCGAGQVCSAGACVCAPGAMACGDTCVVTSSDPKNCGACNNACASELFCEAGQCVIHCSPGFTRCGQSCVTTQTDDNHCGGCGVICDQGQSCHAGTCAYDVVAACYTNGQVRGMRADTLVTGPLKTLGSSPQALERYGNDTVLSIDGTDQKLYQAKLSDLSKLAPETQIGAVPNHVLASAPYVFVANSGDGTVSILKEGADAGFATVMQVQLGTNSFPQVMAKVGSKLYVTLYGGFDSTTWGAGQKVVEIDLTDPEAPALGRTFDLSALALRTFEDGGTSVPRPQGITARGDKLYVALNHLSPDYSVAGPGYLATIALDTATVSAIELPETTCLNPAWTRTVGDHVVVACAGRTDWSTFSTSASGLALVGATDQVLSSLELACPANNDGGCASVSLSRFGVVGSSIFVGDQSAGRMFVVDVADGGLVEKRGYSAQGPLDVCPVNATTGYSNVSDVLAVP